MIDWGHRRAGRDDPAFTQHAFLIGLAHVATVTLGQNGQLIGIFPAHI
jgi:hypothetical protein